MSNQEIQSNTSFKPQSMPMDDPQVDVDDNFEPFASQDQSKDWWAQSDEAIYEMMEVPKSQQPKVLLSQECMKNMVDSFHLQAIASLLRDYGDFDSDSAQIYTQSPALE